MLNRIIGMIIGDDDESSPQTQQFILYIVQCPYII